jgi:anti-sigma28 factor (negative regulator of flagellin synthesis)
VSEQEEQQNQQQVSKDSKVPKSKKKKRFAVGDELKQLRAELDSLRENLHWAQAMEDEKRVADLKSAIKTGTARSRSCFPRRFKC